MSTHLSSISNTFFVNLLNRLGVRPPPPDGFDLINVVQPVSLVDSDIVLPVSLSTILLDLPFTAGYVLNPAAAATLADTGVQVAGTYQVNILLGEDGQAAPVAVLEVVRRNAANSADIWAQLVLLAPTGVGFFQIQARLQLQTNERIIVRNKVSLAASGVTVNASIWIVAG